MVCYVCKMSRYVRAFGRWHTRSGRPFVRFRCDNPACKFAYGSVDGQERKGQPTWMVSEAELAAGAA